VLANGEFAGWLVWLPGSNRLLAGPAAAIGRYGGYAIDAPTAAARTFTFFPGSSYLANAPSDITYGAVLVSRTALPRRHSQPRARPEFASVSLGDGQLRRVVDSRSLPR